MTELRSRGVSVTDAQAGSLQHSDGSTSAWTLAFLPEGPPWAPFLLNYGVPAEEWPARFPERGFPIDPWSLDHLVVETSDPSASAGWLAGVLGNGSTVVSMSVPAREHGDNLTKAPHGVARR